LQLRSLILLTGKYKYISEKQTTKSKQIVNRKTSAAKTYKGQHFITNLNEFIDDKNFMLGAPAVRITIDIKLDTKQTSPNAKW